MLLDPPNGKTGKVGPRLGQFSSEGGGVPLSILYFIVYITVPCIVYGCYIDGGGGVFVM